MYWKIQLMTDGISAEGQETLRFAAQELKRYLHMATADSILLCEAANPDDRGIILGVDAGDELPTVEDAALDDAILINVKNHAGVITGTNPRSVLIAVYRFLKELGYVFIRPGVNGESVPAQLPERAVFVREKASFRQRAVCIEGSDFYEAVEDMIDWLPKAGMNGYFIQFFVPGTFFRRWYEHKGYEYVNPYLKREELSDADIAGMTDSLVREIKKRGLLYHGVGHGWTCQPFGLPSTGWETMDPADVPEDTRQFFALRDGKRELFEGKAINTNLCYGNPETRRRMVDGIIRYCSAHAEVDYLHIWLADGSNNHCECPLCRDHRPADLYVTMLNELDERLTAIGNNQKIVMLMYVDLLWAPVETRIKNKDRFILMFAPITRSYSAPLPSDTDIPAAPYVRNQLEFSSGADAMIAFLKEWRKAFDGECVVFDYYYMWDCYLDPGRTAFSQVIYEDIRHYRDLGFCGLISCQGQRVFAPTSLGMNVMARTLWDRECDFDTVREETFRTEYGDGYEKVMAYMEGLSHTAVPTALRGEKPMVSAENAALFAKGLEETGLFRATVEEYRQKSTGMHRYSWEHLQFHVELTARLPEAYAAIAAGETGVDRWSPIEEFVSRNEWNERDYFDAFEFKRTVGPKICYHEKLNK